MTSLLARLALVLAALSRIDAITQTRTLIWTEKETSDGVVNIKGIPGDPHHWVRHGIRQYSISYFTDAYSRNTSFRLALGFRYASHDLSFSDRGFKNIYRIYLKRAPHVPFQYYVPLHTVYTGISTQVYGMAVDWLSGSIYWTDALYNWITVARLIAQDIFNHIITTELDRPMGIAVHPQNGSLYWTDLGAVAKIERSRLDGTDRQIFIRQDLDKPLGLSVDYAAGRLYWVDDFRHTIESVDLVTGDNRRRLHVTRDVAARPKLFALSIFEDFIFVSEQIGMTIMIFNKTTSRFIKHVNAAIFENTSAIPYDVTMYDLTVQENVDSDCSRLRCSDICISDGGQRAHCICRMGYELVNGTRCIRRSPIIRPMYVYSIGQQLCGTHIRITDLSRGSAPSLVRCFHSLPGRRISSLAFHVYADLLYFADVDHRLLHRMRMETTTGEHAQVVAANTGRVGGAAVDWIADNLYWADEDRGFIVVSRLDGRYQSVLLRGLTRPKSINVNPLNGLMYWVNGQDEIHVASLDGTQRRLFLRVNGSRFDGMVIDVRRDRLYWVDSALPGIRAVRLDGSEQTVMMHANGETFLDVTVYQSLFAWTNGQQSIYFGRTNGLAGNRIEPMRGIRHLFDNTSHDIITYDEYLQPPLDENSTVVDLCDLDNDQVGCQQLCVLVPGGRRQCACAVGFRLADDQRSCISEPLMDNFLLFVDPVMKGLYQVDLATIGSGGAEQVRGIDVRTSNVPARAAFDVAARHLYWHDSEYDGLNVIKRMSLAGDIAEHSLTVLAPGHDVGNVEFVPTINRFVFSESTSHTLHLVDPASPKAQQKLSAVRRMPSAFAVDQLTGRLYWAEGAASQLVGERSFSDGDNTYTIYTCRPESCSSRDAAQSVVSWNSNKTIIGLHVAVDCDWNITFWTSTDVYGVKIGNVSRRDRPTIELLFDGGKRAFNVTNAVSVDDRIFFTGWRSNTVWMMSRDRQVSALTDPVFSRLTDLKAYRSKSYREPKLTDNGMSTALLAALIAAGALLILVLVIFLFVLMTVVNRRRRSAKSTAYKPEAHDNPTYMSHRDLNANLAAAGSPIEVVFDADGAFGVTFYADDEKKKVPLDDDDVVVAAAAGDPTSCYSQYDEKIASSDDWKTGYDYYDYDDEDKEEKASLPGIEPPSTDDSDNTHM